MNPLFIRKRCLLGNSFLEVFVVWRAGSLQLPTEMPSRFKGRILRHAIVQSFMVYEIQSDSQTCAQRNRQNIVQDGFWIIESDWIPHGGIPEKNIPGRSVLFGLPVTVSMTFELWRNIQLQFQVEPYDAPITVYHGTDKQFTKSILQQGLKASFGMFGTGIYFGSFWKAFRFATLTQDYEKRSGTIFRCLAFWRSVYIRNHTLPQCACCGPAKTYADHKGTWLSSGKDVLYLYPVMLDDKKWAVKNEEWFTPKADKVFLDSFAYAERPDGPGGAAHDPWARDYCIE